ncbi:MAG TPA: Stealth CR1 domain-containing protein, partial [Bacteroidales bacterium]|nr:Stealth CR1 domain-containing protein [Bacteroidales bacterium]
MYLKKEDTVDPVDAVIMWVDGRDPVHMEKRRRYLPGAEPDHLDCALNEYRFLDSGEVKYCVFSIRKFAPWIRNIYIVSDEQHPEWLTEEVASKLNVTVVDHIQIFEGYQENLPTFNNLSIMSVIWKIPGLAEKYILFNDDTFLVNETGKEDFYEGDRIVLRGIWKPFSPGIFKIFKKFIKQTLKTGKIRRVNII